MSDPVYINKSNSVNNYTYKFQLPRNVDFSKKQVMVEKVSIYYSWFSISSLLNNNQLKLVVPTSGADLNLTITIPDGTYSAETLNQMIQNTAFIPNNLYLINNTDGSYKYFGEFIENPQSYAIQWNSFPLKTFTGYTSAGMTFPATPKTMILNINNSKFGDIIGFSPALYPATMSLVNYSVISDKIPQVSPVSSVYLSVSVASNEMMPNSNVIFSFTTKGTQYGSLVEASNYLAEWSNCIQGTRSDITIQFLTQDMTPLPIRDTDLTCILRIKQI